MKIGRYQVLRELGRGGMGVVYLAEDPVIGRTVAVKTIRIKDVHNEAEREELRQRLHREARSAGVLSHPGIVTIHDIGGDGDEAYIVMEFVSGTTLDRILSTHVPQHTDFLLGIICRSAEALDFAHSRNIVHRDIKPSNIMVSDDGLVKIADFGIAKLSASASATQTGLVLGTPNYMSPEQAQAHGVDGRSDQFSLAVVAAELLTGALPFGAPTITAVLSKILWEEPRFEGSQLSDAAKAVLRRALSKAPESRYPTCTEFAESLARAVKEAVPVQPPAVQPPQAVAAPAAAPTVEFETDRTLETAPREALPADSRPSPARGGLWAAAAVLVLATVAGAWYFTRGSSDTPAPPAPAGPTVASSPAAPAAVPAPPETQAAAVTEPGPAQPAATTAPPAKKSDAAPRRPVPTTPAVPPSPPATAESVAAGAAKAPAASPRVEAVRTGTLVWSGKLRKNSLLVIADGKPNVGTLQGALPGVPVTIEVEPASVAVRAMPAEENGWKTLILHCSEDRAGSVTVHWSTAGKGRSK